MRLFLALLLLLVPAWGGPAQVTLIPSRRCSAQVDPEVRMYSPVAGSCRVRVRVEGTERKVVDFPLAAGREVHGHLDLGPLCGELDLEFSFLDGRGRETARLTRGLQRLDTGTRSTQTLDGCWISLYHWSEDEGRRFNPDLGRLSAAEWRGQILAMGRLGIRHVIIQNVFECDEYAGKHDMAANRYKGRAYYPSRLYPARHQLGCADPVEAILAAADEGGLDVFLGVGLYAWFDFSPESLRWHKAVTRELFQRYGHHASLYGWYVSEEIFGSLYHEWAAVKPAHHRDLPDFFRSYQRFLRRLTPTRPVALAPNNERFEKYAGEWARLLRHVDILIPFGFARDAEHMNVAAVAAICAAAGSHFWVDMEMFAWPIEAGLAPKTGPELVREIRRYDSLEQIYGYQFTGLMNPPDSTRDLGGAAARQLYLDYQQYLTTIGRKP